MRTDIESPGIWRHLAAVFVIVLANYLLSAPRHVMLDDDGYFILAAWFGGVAHPPGYPLYTTIASLFAHLPFGSVAFRVHACSAVFGALACVVLWRIMLRLSASHFAAWVAALCFGFSGTFWSQATVAEVYSLNVFLFLLLFWLCLDAGSDVPNVRQRASKGAVIAGLFGLSLTNHWPLMLLSLPALVAVAWPHRRVLAARPGESLAWFCAGLLPYAWMVYRSNVSEIAFFGPIQNWNDFWYYLSRQAYREIDQSPTSGLMEKFLYGKFALQEAARQYWWPGAALGILGFILQWRRWPWPVCWGLLAGFAGNSLALAVLLGFDWDLLHQHAFRVYPLVAYSILALWLGLGTLELSRGLERINRDRSRVTGFALGVFVCAGVWIKHAPGAFRASDSWAVKYADAVLESLPPGAAFFVQGDTSIGPIGYRHYIEGVRPDVNVYSAMGELFSNRLFSPRELGTDRATASVLEFIRTDPRRIFYSFALPHNHGVTFHGFYHEVDRSLPPGGGRVSLAPDVQEYFGHMFARGEPRDEGEALHYRMNSALYCRALAAITAGSAQPAPEREMEQRCGGFYGLVERITPLLEAPGADLGALDDLLRRAEARAGEAAMQSNFATLDYLRGRYLLRTGRQREAQAHFLRSLSRWPGPMNPSQKFINTPVASDKDEVPRH